MDDYLFGLFALNFHAVRLLLKSMGVELVSMVITRCITFDFLIDERLFEMENRRKFSTVACSSYSVFDKETFLNVTPPFNF